MNEDTLKAFIKPFLKVELYLKALLIVHMFFSEKNPNYDNINICFSLEFNNQYDKKQIKNFVDDTILFKHSNALEFISTLPQYEKALHIYGLEKSIPSITVDVDVDKCIFCGNNSQFWFEYAVPRFQRMPTLYCIDKIGIYYFIMYIVYVN